MQLHNCKSPGTTFRVFTDFEIDARWNGAIVDQGGPTNEQLTSLWKQLATKYKTQTRIVFAVMNEPHDSG
jgi:endoglucanase